MAENHYKCSPGPPDFTKVIVNAQGVFIPHYTVSRILYQESSKTYEMKLT